MTSSPTLNRRLPRFEREKEAGGRRVVWWRRTVGGVADAGCFVVASSLWDNAGMGWMTGYGASSLRFELRAQ